MQTGNRLFDDLARMAGGALSTLGALREEIEARVKERVERLAVDLDLVTREEFEAVREMAVKAREEQERLAARVAELEERLGARVAELEARLSALEAAAAKPRVRRGGAAGEAGVEDAG